MSKGACSTPGSSCTRGGHARNGRGSDAIDLHDVLKHKWQKLGELASDSPEAILTRLSSLHTKSAGEVADLLDFRIANRGQYE